MRLERRALLFLLLIGVLPGLLLALLIWQFLSFRAGLGVLPEGMTVAGMEVGGKTIDEALTDLDAALSQEIGVAYQEETLLLAPENVEFRFDAQGTRLAIEEALSDRGSFGRFLDYLLRRSTEPVALPAVTFHSPEQVEAFLDRVAQQYDQPPQPPVPLPERLTFRAGRPGYRLDRERSRQRLVEVLRSAEDRRVEMVVQVEDAPALQMEQLEEVLTSVTRGFPGVAGIFVKDLETGDELGINDGVAYAGMSVLKIPLMVETYRLLDTSPTLTQTELLSLTITESENHTANELIEDIGDGDVNRGALSLTSSMTYLGLVNTFMAAPYDEDILPFTVVTPANVRSDLSTEPDPYMQTTPRDMGLLLEMLYQCSEGGGSLLIAYPDAFTPHECRQMLDMMLANRIDSLIEVGLPPETVVAHKQGVIPDTHADAAVVFSPQGDFVLVIFLYHPTWLDWELSNHLMSEIATATYNYFNPAE